jgi:DNA-binding NtrC family response regulator
MAAARTEERAETRTGPPSASKVSGDNWPAVERELILQTLRTTRGNRSKAAELLGWGRTTLWRKIVQYGLG